MVNLKLWKDVFTKTFEEYDIVFSDKDSLYLEVANGYVVLEKQGPGLIIDFRRTTDSDTSVVSESLIVDGKCVGQITQSNRLQLAKLVEEFASKV
jgi:hypothetical protein